jgi:pimeloyl-ACP methyl ester carboxylesterase
VRRVSFVFAAAAAVLALGGGTAGSSPAASDPCRAQAGESKPVRLTASDGARIYGLELGNGTTGVVLAHQYLSDHCEWIDFAKELRAAGMRVLAIDFRGYGASTVGRGSGVRLDRDVAAAAARLRADGSTRIYLVGASMGGTAVLAAGRWIRPAVAGVVSLSGPAAFRGIDALAAVKRSRVPERFLAGRLDTQFAVDARRLAKAAVAKDKAVALYPSALHGSSLLADRGAHALVLRFVTRG